jgi:hypothetical protein
VFSALGGQLANSLMVFGDQASSNQKRLDDLADSACWQGQSRRQHVEPLRTFGEQGQVLLFVRAETKTVDLFKLAGSVKVCSCDCRFAARTAHTTSRLQQSQSEPWRSSGTSSDERQDFINGPPFK